MMVWFTSMSTKGALKPTRRILDLFAERVGDDTWRTVVTADGLAMIRQLLKKSANKNTAVACHWVRSRSDSELLWVVGDRSRFNASGVVPVSTTTKSIVQSGKDNVWGVLPEIKALVAVAALLHDIGKANDFFQNKLQKAKKSRIVADPYRHEWVSCMILSALVSTSSDPSTDSGWLSILRDENGFEKALSACVLGISKDFTVNLEDLPPIAQMICWLILSHHRLPGSTFFKTDNIVKNYQTTQKLRFSEMLRSISFKWGYENEPNEFNGLSDKDKAKVLTFTNGLPIDSAPWKKALSKWAGRLDSLSDDILARYNVAGSDGSATLRVILLYSRLSLMFGDYKASSCPADELWPDETGLYANTDSKGNLKQKLDEHLVHVMEESLKIAHLLPKFECGLESAADVSSLRHKSPVKFKWQDTAVSKIKSFRKDNGIVDSERQGWFILNMASTGCGKTFANAKIMRVISPDGNSLRYSLALGLRSLTLQTGDEYRERIGLGKDELAVVIGSSATQELHEMNRQFEKNAVNNPDEEYEELLDNDVLFTDEAYDGVLDILFSSGRTSSKGFGAKHKAFLYKPVLVSTIDCLMGATETKRGGRYMLPLLRLMSSDLVIDEVDDFNVDDLWAISRLVHLAGMLGRNVVLSSASIPPELAVGLFKAYSTGWHCYAKTFGTRKRIACGWCDEYTSRVTFVQGETSESCYGLYAGEHQRFVDKRVKKLVGELVKRRAELVPCSVGMSKQEYYQKMMDAAIKLHDNNHVVVPDGGKKVSFGLIRCANITPCVELGRFLLEAEWPDGYTPRVLVYHSRQVLLLRNELEKHLDVVLKRKNDDYLQDDVVWKHLHNADSENVLFILVATPVEEIGRDHDFDWAVLEPSSYRSIIQLAGRVMRHRDPREGDASNIAIMGFNIRGIRNEKFAFCKPGFETEKRYLLPSHDMAEIADMEGLRERVDSVLRIRNVTDNDRALLRLEHKVVEDFQNTDDSVCGPISLRGWLNEYWWLTALPVVLHPFRSGILQETIYRVYGEKGPVFTVRDESGKFLCDGRGEPISVERSHNINSDEELSQVARKRLWLDRNYIDALIRYLPDNVTLETEMSQLRVISERYGSVDMPMGNGEWYYSDELGLYKKS